MSRPTVEDMRRDLGADLAAIKDACEPGCPWIKAEIAHGWMQDILREAARLVEQGPPPERVLLLALGRYGWPAAIRRAQHAEAEVREFVRLAHAAANATDDAAHARAVHDFIEQARGNGWTDVPETVVHQAVQQAERAVAEIQRLQAAGAGMLAALKELLAAYEDGVNQCHCDRSGHMVPGPCTACRARGAIALAEGRAG